MANEFRVKNGIITPKIISEESDGRVVLTQTATGDNEPIILAFETAETDIAADDVLGKITFAAPDEGTGTNALLVGAAIQAVSEGDFAANSNATKMVFQTAANGTAATKMAISSAGQVTATAGLNATSTTTGTVKVTGGVGISNNLYAGGATRFTANTASSSTTTGTLVVTGGTGISEDLYVGADAYIGDNLSLTSDAARLIMGADSEVSFRHEADNGFSIYTPSSVAKPIALKLMNENAGATGAVLKFHKDSSSLAANDKMGHIEFSSTDGDDADMLYGQIRGISSDITDEHELGAIQLQVRSTSGNDTTHLIEGLTVAGTNPGSLGDGGVRVTIGGENAGDSYTGVTESSAGSAITGIIHPTDKTSTFQQYAGNGSGSQNQQLQQPAFNIGGGIVPYEYTTVAKQLTGGSTTYITPKYLANLYVNATGYSEARISSVTTQTESHSVSSLGTALVLETAGEQNNLGIYWTRNREHTEFSWINQDTSAALTNGDFTWGMGPAAVDSTQTLFALNEMVWGFSGDDYNAVMGKGLTSLNSTSTHPIDLPIMALGTGGGLYLKEQAAAAADRAAYGQLWVDDAAPNALYFTNDAGNDIQITSGSSLAGSAGSLSGLGSTDNVLMRVNGTGGQTAQGSGIVVDDSNNVSSMGTLGVGAITTTGALKVGSAAGSGVDAFLYTAGTAAHVGIQWDANGNTEGTLIGGADDHGVDFKFFGESSGKYIQWDMSGDELVLASSAKISFHDAAGDENIVASADGHLEINAGTTLDMTSVTIDINGTTEVQVDTPTFDVNGTTAVTIDCTNTTNGVKIGTSTSGVPVTIGHSTSEVTVADNLTVTGDLTVNGATTTISTATIEVEDNILNLNRTQDSTDTATAATSGISIYRGDGVTEASFIFDDGDDTWDLTNDIKINGTTASSSASTGSLVVAGGVGIAADLYVGDDLRLRSDSSVFAMGLNADDFSITHDGTTGATIAGNPITITAGGASTWSTSSGALTLTAAAASTWSTAAGALTITSAAACTWSTTAGILTIDGDDGVQISSTATGNIDLDAAADIVLDVADNKHVFFQEGGVTHSAIAHGTVEITDLAGTASATAIDVFDCTVFQAVKYFILVEDTAADHYMTTEILVLGDDNGGSAATAVMTTYAVLFNEAELGVFTVAGSGNNITLSYNPSDQDGTDQHRVRVVANRIASLSDTGQ